MQTAVCKQPASFAEYFKHQALASCKCQHHGQFALSANLPLGHSSCDSNQLQWRGNFRRKWCLSKQVSTRQLGINEVLTPQQ
ncbi:hypothetical protein WJX74_010305 [Apatococcus lobatus]|uniref:Uncharacterized protein n=1 Tax=Apatococcus lobatus TaxID=904363 RepID=A0AAW1RM89_9CHLO